jgi:hypothetical protein
MFRLDPSQNCQFNLATAIFASLGRAQLRRLSNISKVKESQWNWVRFQGPEPKGWGSRSIFAIPMDHCSNLFRTRMSLWKIEKIGSIQDAIGFHRRENLDARHRPVAAFECGLSSFGRHPMKSIARSELNVSHETSYFFLLL